MPQALTRKDIGGQDWLAGVVAFYSSDDGFEPSTRRTASRNFVCWPVEGGVS